MSDEFLRLFDIKPDYDLDIMEDDQTPQDVIINTFRRLQPIFNMELPNWLIIQGDTTTAFASALLGFSNKVNIAHIEAGLRTYDKYQPYPEEINRRLISHIVDVHFAPTDSAKENLIKENIPKEKIFVVGNTVVASLHEILNDDKNFDLGLKRLIKDREFILLTAHRRENFGESIMNISQAMLEISKKYRDLLIIYPVHPNPNIKNVVYSILDGVKNIKLMKPLDYKNFIFLMNKARFILTDSGGIQEEAISLNKYVFVLRNKTERAELVECGWGEVLGTNKAYIVKKVINFIENEGWRRPKATKNPFGDGNASRRIVKILFC
jgi:UDP-N-acetylglucosamine 2-epimerase (non-hydrolysing)